jgi:hypothetical protein
MRWLFCLAVVLAVLRLTGVAYVPWLVIIAIPVAPVCIGLLADMLATIRSNWTWWH